MRHLITLGMITVFTLTASFVRAQEFEFTVLTDSDAASFVIESDGNIDGDDELDVIVGCATGCDENNQGAVYIFLGKSIDDNTLDLSLANYVTKGSAANSYFGSDVGFLNDEDGDTYDEIIVGFGEVQEYEVIQSSELDADLNTIITDETVAQRHAIHVNVGASTGDCSLNPSIQSFNASHFGVMALLAAGIFILKALRLAVSHTDHQFKTSKDRR